MGKVPSYFRKISNVRLVWGRLLPIIALVTLLLLQTRRSEIGKATREADGASHRENVWYCQQ